MAGGAVRAAPYTAAVELARWAGQPGIWHQLDGEYTGRGVDIRRLPFDRFLNLVYAEMLQRLRVRDRQSPEDARKSLDLRLGVSAWTVPGREPLTAEPVDPKAPWWWTGSEDASQSFLRSMGVSL